MQAENDLRTKEEKQAKDKA
jgi:adenylate kinase